ncbi:hypothetical protein HNQ35_000089 [Cerasibacillus quisquiliarum]|mgnify:CR=1 FL=1|nr:hypothetical protein [Cerasibacillus quisquiliarum]
MLRKLLTFISITFLILLFLMLSYSSSSWYSSFFDSLWEINAFFPLFFGIISILSAFWGIKGSIRLTLILLNTFILIMFFIAFLMGYYGFKEP